MEGSAAGAVRLTQVSQGQSVRLQHGDPPRGRRTAQLLTWGQRGSLQVIKSLPKPTEPVRSLQVSQIDEGDQKTLAMSGKVELCVNIYKTDLKIRRKLSKVVCTRPKKETNQIMRFRKLPHDS